MKTVKVSRGMDEPVTDVTLSQAISRGRNAAKQQLSASAVQYLPDFELLLLTLADGSAVALPVRPYPELKSLSTAELMRLQLAFGGTAICLDERDLHVSVAGMIRASESLMALATVVTMSRNGSLSSEAKAQASRENGVKGGRPRKLASI